MKENAGELSSIQLRRISHEEASPLPEKSFGQSDKNSKMAFVTNFYLGEHDEDAFLLDGIRSKQIEVMTLLFDRYSQQVYSIAFYFVQSSEKAENIMQDVLLRLWTDPSVYDRASLSLERWIIVTTLIEAKKLAAKKI